MLRPSLIAAALLAASACGGTVQQNSTGAGGSSGSAATGGSPGVGGSGGAEQASGLVGTWKGYVENYEFQDQSDVVTMTITDARGDGHVAVGTAAPPPPATDPNIGYPPGAQFSLIGGPSFVLWPGFSYSIVNLSFDGQRLQFDVAPNELWQTWCAMQIPIADSANPGVYNCVQNWANGNGPNGGCFETNPQTQQDVPIDCGKLALCMTGTGPCRCTSQSCSVPLQASVHFDMVVGVPHADGSVAGLDSSVHNVHLTKQ